MYPQKKIIQNVHHTPAFDQDSDIQIPLSFLRKAVLKLFLLLEPLES